jgi:hypothetical protein
LILIFNSKFPSPNTLSATTSIRRSTPSIDYHHIYYRAQHPTPWQPSNESF